MGLRPARQDYRRAELHPALWRQLEVERARGLEGPSAAVLPLPRRVPTDERAAVHVALPAERIRAQAALQILMAETACFGAAAVLWSRVDRLSSHMFRAPSDARFAREGRS